MVGWHCPIAADADTPGFRRRRDAHNAFRSTLTVGRSPGKGRLWSWIIMHRRYIKEFDPPYLVGFVELDEGPMLVRTIVGARPEQLVCDLPLEVVFEPATAEMSIVKFRPVAGASAPDRHNYRNG